MPIKLTRPHGWYSVNGQVVADCGVSEFPISLLIDRRGNIVILLNTNDVDGAKEPTADLLRK
ncbi:MAG TPA: hypothetical protein VMR25_25810 [Planctomycetaceae bacterium]|jgi:hypothetical protein|nr:hypothetical protein [Planctomycetaceae bacterium]